MVFYTGLARVAREAGLEVREVPNWESRTIGTRPDGMSEARGLMYHHTATDAEAVKDRNNPTLDYVTDGLGYPSANLLTAWDGSIDVVAAGAAAHAGKGRYGSRVPANRGNDFLIGNEIEGTTGLTMSNDQLEALARLGHAFTKEFGETFLHVGHLEYAPRRKVDPSGIPGGMPAMRKAVARGYWKDKNWKPGSKVGSDSTVGTASNNKKPTGGQYPAVALKRTKEHTAASHDAWVKLMDLVGYDHADLGMNLQSWLNDLTDPRTGKGYYDLNVYNHDGVMGPVAVKGLQRKLYDTSIIGKKHLYYGAADGDRGPKTVLAEIDYLNWQRQYL